MPDQAAITRWHLLQNIFHEVSAVPQEERAALLEFRCDGDADLRKRIEALLEASEKETAMRAVHELSSDALLN